MEGAFGLSAVQLRDAKRTLAPGKLADMVVLEKDITTIPAAGIKDVRVLATWVGGKKVCEAGK